MREKDKPLISVISIIYMVEPYLRECLNSLSSLSYPNLEIILVAGRKEEIKADGTVELTDDGCFSMAEEFAAADKRFRVVPVIAAGAGDARNRGLDAAKGEYIGFVDGDDYVEPDMFDRLYDNIREYGADISVCGKYREYPGRSEAEPFDPTSPPEVLSAGDAARMLLNGSGFFFHSWDKLFKAELFDGMRFPTDKYLEDRYTIGDIILSAGKIVYDRRPLYHFRIRSDSLSNHVKMSEMNVLADSRFAEKALQSFPELKDEAEACLLYGHITCLQNALVNGYFDRKEAEQHFSYIREHKDTAANPKVGRSTRIKAFLALHFLFGLKLITLYGKRKQERVKRFTKDT